MFEVRAERGGEGLRAFVLDDRSRSGLAEQLGEAARGAAHDRSPERQRFEAEVPRDDLARFYLGARVVAVPSRHENLPYAGLEALAFGRPVVCRSSSGLAELLRESGAGTVVEDEGPEALAAALRPYLEDPRRAAEASASARELVERHCAPDVIAAQREAVYEQAVSSARRRRRSPSGTGA